MVVDGVVDDSGGGGYTSFSDARATHFLWWFGLHTTSGLFLHGKATTRYDKPYSSQALTDGALPLAVAGLEPLNSLFNTGTR